MLISTQTTNLLVVGEMRGWVLGIWEEKDLALHPRTRLACGFVEPHIVLLVGL